MGAGANILAGLSKIDVKKAVQSVAPVAQHAVGVISSVNEKMKEKNSGGGGGATKV